MQNRFSSIVHAALWVLVIILAFVMQVFPLLLILTMLNMAIGISSNAVLIAIPAAILGTLVLAFIFAARRRREWRPSPVRVDEVRYQQMTGNKAASRIGALLARDFRRRWFF